MRLALLVAFGLLFAVVATRSESTSAAGHQLQQQLSTIDGVHDRLETTMPMMMSEAGGDGDADDDDDGDAPIMMDMALEGDAEGEFEAEADEEVADAEGRPTTLPAPAPGPSCPRSCRRRRGPGRGVCQTRKCRRCSFCGGASPGGSPKPGPPVVRPPTPVSPRPSTTNPRPAGTRPAAGAAATAGVDTADADADADDQGHLDVDLDGDAAKPISSSATSLSRISGQPKCHQMCHRIRTKACRFGQCVGCGFCKFESVKGGALSPRPRPAGTKPSPTPTLKPTLTPKPIVKEHIISRDVDVTGVSDEQQQQQQQPTSGEDKQPAGELSRELAALLSTPIGSMLRERLGPLLMEQLQRAPGSLTDQAAPVAAQLASNPALMTALARLRDRITRAAATTADQGGMTTTATATTTSDELNSDELDSIITGLADEEEENAIETETQLEGERREEEEEEDGVVVVAAAAGRGRDQFARRHRFDHRFGHRRDRRRRHHHHGRFDRGFQPVRRFPGGVGGFPIGPAVIERTTVINPVVPVVTPFIGSVPVFGNVLT